MLYYPYWVVGRTARLADSWKCQQLCYILGKGIFLCFLDNFLCFKVQNVSSQLMNIRTLAIWLRELVSKDKYMLYFPSELLIVIQNCVVDGIAQSPKSPKCQQLGCVHGKGSFLCFFDNFLCFQVQKVSSQSCLHPRMPTNVQTFAKRSSEFSFLKYINVFSPLKFW